MAVETGTHQGRAPRPAPLPPPGDAGPRARRPTAGQLAVVPALLVPVVLVSVSFLPGHMSNDTLSQIQQVRDGHFTNQHAPLLMAMWRVVWPLGVGPGWVLLAQVTVFVAGTYLVLRSFLSRWVAVALAVAVALSPPVFGMLGYLSRDTWFTALLMAAFGLMARAAGAAPGPAARRRAWLAGAALALWLALASRQNAAPAVAMAAAALVWVAWPGRPRGGRLRRPVVLGAAGVALTVGLLASQLVAAGLLDVHDAHPEQYVLIYDLEVLSHDQRRNLFPADVMPRRGVEVIDQHYNIDSVNPLLFSTDPPVGTPLADGPYRSLRRAWADAVTDNPDDYLGERMELWLRQIALTRTADFIYHPAIDPNRWGYEPWFDDMNDTARDYVEAFTDDPRTLKGGPLHTVWVYLAVATAGGLVLFVGRRRPAQRLVGFMGLAAVTHQAGLFFGAMGTQYRFQFPVVVIGVVVAVALLQVMVERRQR